MSEQSKLYAVTEVGGFGEMTEIEDPTIQEVGKKKKKEQSIEELIKETTEANKRNFCR